MSEQKKYLESIKTLNVHTDKCSKCFKPIGSGWEENACKGSLDIEVDCCSLEHFFGKESDQSFFSHPALLKKSGYQKLYVSWGKNEPYKLCWHCHRDFMKLIGSFLLEPKK